MQRHIEAAIPICRLDYGETPPGRFQQERLPLAHPPETEYWLLLLTPPWYSRDSQIRELVRYSPDGAVQARMLLKNKTPDFPPPN